MSRRSPRPQPKLAYDDPKFMESLVARPLRIMAEYIDPLNRLRLANVSDTIVMFGSARILSRDRALAASERSKATRERQAHARMAPESQCGAVSVSMSRYYEEARELAHRLITCGR